MIKRDKEYNRYRDAIRIYFHDAWVGCTALWGVLTIATTADLIFNHDKYVTDPAFNYGIIAVCWLVPVLIFAKRMILCAMSLRDMRRGNIEKKEIIVKEVKYAYRHTRGKADQYTRYILVTSEGERYKVCPRGEFLLAGTTVFSEDTVLLQHQHRINFGLNKTPVIRKADAVSQHGNHNG